MLKIIDKSTDPYWNLAAEEYILLRFDCPVFRLWRNSDAIIVGRNQNTLAEIDREFVEKEHIPVVRRMTGGGAVFHDLGNVNYSFFNYSSEGSYEGGVSAKWDFTAVIIEGLSKLGLAVSTSGRNDILLDGKKISGTAVCKHNGRVLQHGTLLFSAQMERLSGALRPRPEKFEGKGVKSVRSRVTNIANYLTAAGKPASTAEPEMTAEDFFNFLAENILPDAEAYSYSAEDLAAIEKLREEKYATYEWNFGISPVAGCRKIKKFPFGLVEAYMEIEKGRIARIDIRGDYFFTRPTAELCALLEGCEFTKEKIADRLKSVAVDDFISGITEDLFVSFLLF